MYSKLGMAGAISSGDGVHIPWDRCPASLASAYTGKEKVPTIGYNVALPALPVHAHVRGD